MLTRRYYSIRTGKNPNARFTLPFLSALFSDLFNSYWEKGYFQEAFGYDCIDQGDVPGYLGSNVQAQIFRILRKTELWPIKAYYDLVFAQTERVSIR